MNNMVKAMALAVIAVMTIGAMSMSIDGTDAATDGDWADSADTSWYDAESPETEYTLNTAEQLAGLAQLVNQGNTFKGVTISLGNNIDLSAHSWTPIGFGVIAESDETLDSITMFEGTFDGDGYSITGLTSEGFVADSGDGSLDGENTYSYGLFGFLNGATVSDIVFEGINIDLGDSDSSVCDSAGAVAGYAVGTTNISGITVKDGTITSADATGGILGRYYGSETLTISDCSNSADISSTDANGGKSGGIIGTMAYATNVTISGCNSSADVKGAYAGGIAGMMNSSVSGCTQSVTGCTVSDSTVSGLHNAGGLVGRGCIGVSLSDSSVTDSNISATSDDGKSVGNAGGLMGGQSGMTSTIAVSDCSVSGCTVNAEASAGGFIGASIGPVITISGGSITDLTANAVCEIEDVDATYAGGIVGSIIPGSIIEVSIEDVEQTGSLSLEASNEDFVWASAYCGVLEGSAVGYMAGIGTFTLSNLEDVSVYELIAEARVISDSTVTSEIIFSGCQTENVMEWAIDSTAPEVHLENSVLAGLILDYGKIGIAMEGESSIGQLVAGADEETAESIEDLVYKDKTNQTWITGTFTVLSGQTVTVGNAVATEEHTFVYDSEDPSKLLRKYYGKIVGEDATSSLIVTEGTSGLSKGAYVWDAEGGEWVSAVASIGETNFATLSTAVADVPTDDTETTIILLDDITLSESVNIVSGMNIVLDMGGNTITADIGFDGRLIVNHGTLTITGNGIFDASAENAELNGPLDNYGTLTIENGTFKGNLVSNSVLIWNRENGTATFNDGIYCGSGTTIGTGVGSNTTINGGTYTSPWYSAIDNRGELLIVGGEFTNTSCSSCDSKHWGYTIRNIEEETAHMVIKPASDDDVVVTGTQGALSCVIGTAEVYGGTFKTVDCDSNHGAAFYAFYIAGEDGETAATIYGGSFTAYNKAAVLVGNSKDGGLQQKAVAEIYGGDFSISNPTQGSTWMAIAVDADTSNVPDATVYGGYFSTDISDEIIAEGYEQDADGNIVLDTSTGGEAVAVIGDTQYASLQAAVDAAQPGSTVKLLKDVYLEVNLHIDSPGITIDLNDFTITAAEDFDVGSDPTYTADENLITISADGVILTNGTVKTIDLNNQVVNVFQSKDVVISDIVLDNTGNGGFTYALLVNDSTVTLSGNVTIKANYFGINFDTGSNPKYNLVGLTFASDAVVDFDETPIGIVSEVQASELELIFEEGSKYDHIPGFLFSPSELEYTGEPVSMNEANRWIVTVSPDVDGATVSVIGSDGIEYQPNPDGKYNLPAGKYTVTADAPGYSGTKTMTLEGGIAGGDANLDVETDLDAPKVSIAQGDSADDGSVVLTATPSHEAAGVTYTYQWSDANGSISGATSAEYTAPGPGTYSVQVIASDGTKTSSAATAESTVTAEEPEPEPETVTVTVSAILDGQRVDDATVTVTGEGFIQSGKGSLTADLVKGQEYIATVALDGYTSEPLTFTADKEMSYTIALRAETIDPEPGPGGDDDDTPVIPPIDDDDDYVPLPPQIVYDTDDDDTATVAACAAAAVIAAILAAFIVMEYRRK